MLSRHSIGMACGECNEDACTDSSAVSELTEKDIPGASLKDPFHSHKVVDLNWWLLC